MGAERSECYCVSPMWGTLVQWQKSSSIPSVSMVWGTVTERGSSNPNVIMVQGPVRPGDHLRRGRQLSGFSRKVRSGFVGPHEMNWQVVIGAYLTAGFWVLSFFTRSLQMFSALSCFDLTPAALAGCLLDGTALAGTWLGVGVTATEGSSATIEWSAQPYMAGRGRGGGASGGGGGLGGASGSGSGSLRPFFFLPAER